MKQRYDGSTYVPVTVETTISEPTRRGHLHLVPAYEPEERPIADGDLRSLQIGALDLELGHEHIHDLRDCARDGGQLPYPSAHWIDAASPIAGRKRHGLNSKLA